MHGLFARVDFAQCGYQARKPGMELEDRLEIDRMTPTLPGEIREFGWGGRTLWAFR